MYNVDGVEYYNDIEIYKNYFLSLSLRADTDQALLDEYERIDKTGDTDAALDYLLNTIKPFVHMAHIDENGEFACNLHDYFLFLSSHPVLYTYNGDKFDDILHLVFYNQYLKYSSRADLDKLVRELKKVADLLIETNSAYQWSYKWDYNVKIFPFTGRDLMKILYLDKSRVSLKFIGVILKHYKLQELPIKPDAFIRNADVNAMVRYCFNDLLITRKLKLNQNDEFDIRTFATEHYGINVFNDSRSSVGKKILANDYCNRTGADYGQYMKGGTIRNYVDLCEVVNPNIKFTSYDLNKLLETVYKKRISVGEKGIEKVSFATIFDYIKYEIKSGGLHSVDKPALLIPKRGWIYKDSDVDSYYPNEMLNDKAYPDQLIAEALAQIILGYIGDRVSFKYKAKNETDRNLKKNYKLYAEALKIVINRIYGSLGDSTDPCYDPKAMLTVTINGQLKLLKLIEMLANKDFHIISANTDGIITNLDLSRKAEYLDICSEWEHMFGFKLSYDAYEKYIRRDVNNYMAIKEGFSDLSYDDKRSKYVLEDYVKFKGYFNPELVFSKGYNFPIIKKAILGYFLYDIPIHETIFNGNSIHDYVIAQKVGSSFNILSKFVNEDGEIESHIEQNINRFFVSTDSVGVVKAYKTATYNKNNKRIADKALLKASLSICNDIVDARAFNYNIDYGFYNKVAEQQVYPIINANMKLDLWS